MIKNVTVKFEMQFFIWQIIHEEFIYSESLRCQKSVLSNTIRVRVESVDLVVKQFMATANIEDLKQVLMLWVGPKYNFVARYL